MGIGVQVAYLLHQVHYTIHIYYLYPYVPTGGPPSPWVVVPLQMEWYSRVHQEQEGIGAHRDTVPRDYQQLYSPVLPIPTTVLPSYPYPTPLPGEPPQDTIGSTGYSRVGIVGIGVYIELLRYHTPCTVLPIPYWYLYIPIPGVIPLPPSTGWLVGYSCLEGIDGWQDSVSDHIPVPILYTYTPYYQYRYPQYSYIPIYTVLDTQDRIVYPSINRELQYRNVGEYSGYRC